MKIKNIHCVIFDMDGTIFDTEKLWKNASNVVNKKYNINIDDQFRLECCGRRKVETIKALGKNFPSVNAVSVRTDWEELVFAEIQKGKGRLKKGFLSLLSFLQKQDVTLALATGSKMQQVKDLFERVDLDVNKIFKVIATNDDVKRGKPRPDIFKLVSKRAKISPKKCLVIEDSPNGAKAAWRAGMKVVLVPDVFPPTKAAEKKCEGVFDDLTQVKNYLQNLFKMQ